ncbi:MAG: 23S rRNA (guanosine2251-2'-O)-methyltransferase [Granulosicoccus sp.]|jgi:23S rRNA (guanosine2251-2'-O)-methyltransferase
MNKTPLKFRKLQMDELNRKSIDEMDSVQKIPLVIVLDNIRSLHNVGSVFRSADAFTIEKIYLCGITAQPPHREIQKTALGATESVSWEYREHTLEAVAELKEDNYCLVAVEQTMNSAEPKEFVNSSVKYAVVLGNEVDGVSQDALELCDRCLEIPQDGAKHSLNISIAAGIVMWHFYNLFSKA